MRSRVCIPFAKWEYFGWSSQLEMAVWGLGRVVLVCVCVCVSVCPSSRKTRKIREVRELHKGFWNAETLYDLNHQVKTKQAYLCGGERAENLQEKNPIPSSVEVVLQAIAEGSKDSLFYKFRKSLLSPPPVKMLKLKRGRLLQTLNRAKAQDSPLQRAQG